MTGLNRAMIYSTFFIVTQGKLAVVSASNIFMYFKVSKKCKLKHSVFWYFKYHITHV